MLLQQPCITEADVDAVLSEMPARALTKKIVEYGASVSDSPKAYFLGSALAVQAALIPSNLYMVSATMMRPNLFIFLAGPSGERKSYAGDATIAIMEDMLASVNEPSRKVIDVDSYQALLERCSDFGADPTGLFYFSEGGQYLSQIYGQNGGRLKTAYMALADGNTLTKAKARGAGEQKKEESDVTHVVKDPRFSMLLPTAYRLIQRHVTADDWETGFMGRYLLFCAARERRYELPGVNLVLRQEIADRLFDLLYSVSREHRGRLPDDRSKWDYTKKRCRNLAKPAISGEIGFEPEAWQLFTTWTKQVAERQHAQSASSIKASNYRRVEAQCTRVAMILSRDFGAASDMAWAIQKRHAQDENWFLGMQEVAGAIAIMNLHLKSLDFLLENLHANTWESQRQSILAVFETAEDCPPKMLSRGEILAAVRPRLQLGELTKSLSTLLEDESLFLWNNTIYATIPPKSVDAKNMESV